MIHVFSPPDPHAKFDRVRKASSGEDTAINCPIQWVSDVLGKKRKNLALSYLRALKNIDL